MRREVLINAIMSITDDIVSSGLLATIEKSMSHPVRDGASSWFNLEVFRRYFILTDKYGQAEKDVARILGINNFLDSEYWSNLIDSPDGGEIYEIRTKMQFLVNELPKIAKLLQQEKYEPKNEGSTKKSEFLAEKESITFILPEEENTPSSPARLISALESTSALYEVIATLENNTSNDLILLSLDSGSDKSFDLLGAAKIMEQLRLLIIDIWDRRVLHRQKSISQSLELISSSLPIIQDIDHLKKNGAISPEQAEILKRKTIQGVSKFLESGVIIPEIEEESTQSPRLLMQPEIKMLAAPVEKQESNDQESNIDDDEKLTEDEIEQLEGLLKKAKKNNLTKSNKKRTKDNSE